MSGDETLAATEDGDSGPRRDASVTVAARGDLLGRYVILREVGAGGMGVVYAAYDPELDRKVAIKLLLPHGRDPAAARQRLQREAQAMAKLSHPNVVNVHDVGTLDDRVYVAMEFVAGRTLTKWLAEKGRSWREILQVFVQIGRGLAAAHAQGLLHRDVKPDNMMIDDAGRARIMDFGLARSGDDRPVAAVASALKESALTRLGMPSPLPSGVTRPGAIVGTPAYMAPEQFDKRPLGARADQFAFCVAVWEGLYGERPFEGERMHELAVAVAGGERRRPPKGRKVPAFVRRALERGLSPRAEDRWPTMEALLAELSRDPARRRTRWAAGIVATLAVGLGVASWWRASAEHCGGAEEAFVGVWDDGRRGAVEAAVLATSIPYAPGVWARVGPKLDTWAEGWTSMHTETCEATRRYGEQSEAVMDLRMACLYRAKLGFIAVTNVLAGATPQVVERAHELVDGLPALSACADTDALQADVPPPPPHEEAAVDAARAELADAKARRETGDYEAAMAAARRAEAHVAALAYEPILTDVWLEVGALQRLLGRYPQAEETLGRAQRHAARWKQWDAAGRASADLIVVIGYDQRRPEEALALRNIALGLVAGRTESEAAVRNNVGNVLAARGEPDAAMEEYRAVLALLERSRGQGDLRIAAVRNNIGRMLISLGRYDEAEAEERAALEIREQMLGDDHPDVAQSHFNLGHALDKQGRLAPAEAEHRIALAIRERALGDAHPDVAVSRANLASILSTRGRHPEAEVEARAALAILLKVHGDAHPEVAGLRNNLGSILLAADRPAEAEPEIRAGLAMRLQLLGEDHPNVVASRNSLANVLLAQGDYAGAEAEQRTVLSVRERTLGADHPSTARSRNNLGVVLLERGAYAEAERELRLAIAVGEAALGGAHPLVASSRHNLARVFHARGEDAQAEAEVRAALATREGVLGRDHLHFALSQHLLGEVLRAQGKLADAEVEHRAALKAREKALGAEHPDVADSLVGLGRTLVALGRADEGIALLDRGWAILEQADVPARRRADAAFALAIASWSIPSRRDEARALAERALELHRAAPEPDPHAIEAVTAWLGGHG